MDNGGITIDQVAAEELWEEVVAAARKMLTSPEAELAACWADCPVQHWRRRRVRLQTHSFHAVPHPGEVGPGRRHKYDLFAGFPRYLGARGGERPGLTLSHSTLDTSVRFSD
jgi:hypothetical protein